MKSDFVGRMQRFAIEIKAGGGFSDLFEIILPDREAARTYVIELASDLLHSQASARKPMIVRALIRNEQGEILDSVHSTADGSD